MNLITFASLLAVFLHPNSSQGAPVSQSKQYVFWTADTGSEHIARSLRKASIIPDVLPESFVPSFALSLAYPSSHESVSLGNTIPTKATSSRPVFQAASLKTPSLSPTRTLAGNKTYTLAMSDPDATSRSNPTLGQMAHWIITGIQLNQVNETEGAAEGDGITYALDVATNQASHEVKAIHTSLQEIVEYLPPAPPKKTGKHRYVFVLLEQDDGHEGSKGKIKAPSERPHFGYDQKGKGVIEWATENHLHPVGANFFYAKHKKQ